MANDAIHANANSSNKKGKGNPFIGVVGAGAMGVGIAQVAATAGHNVLLFDVDQLALEKSNVALQLIFKRLVEKQKYSAAVKNENANPTIDQEATAKPNHSTISPKKLAQDTNWKRPSKNINL